MLIKVFDLNGQFLRVPGIIGTKHGNILTTCFTNAVIDSYRGPPIFFKLIQLDAWISKSFYDVHRMIR